MRPEKTMTDRIDPWNEIERPRRVAVVNALRVDVDVRWDVFWGLDSDGSCLLVLQYRKGTELPMRLPRFGGLELSVHSSEDATQSRLVLRLVDVQQRPIFHRLCLDIIEATKRAKEESEAIERFLSRTLRWHRLLRGGRSPELSDEAQRGLLGELRVLELYLIPVLGVAGAVRSWSGPMRASKDFEVGDVYIEAKSCQGASRAQVTITSEDQLDAHDGDTLFLHVALVVAGGDSEGASTLTEVASRVRDLIRVRDLRAADLFEDRLYAVGFDWSHDYSDQRWLCQDDILYQVRGEFPRLTPSMCPSGVTNVRYSVTLSECGQFRVDTSSLTRAIVKGDSDA